MVGIFKKLFKKEKITKYDNGDIYIGEKKNNKRHGQGSYTWSNGNKYVGEYKDGEMSGQGTYTWVEGRKYVGEWKDDKMHGHGSLTDPDGHKYVGEFIDDEFHGLGIMMFPDGSKYDGGFEDGVQCGEGTFTSADGKVEKGTWEKEESKEKKDGFDFLRHKKEEQISDDLKKWPLGLRIVFFDDLLALKSVEWITEKYTNRIREKAIEAAKEKLKYQKKKPEEIPNDQLEDWVMDAEKKIKSKDKWTLLKIILLPTGASLLPWL